MAGESRKRKLDADIASPSASDVSGTLTCPVCLDIFTAPKILSCAHTFCLKCLEGVAHRYGGGVFPCPSCRDFIRIPRGGVSAFKTNFYIKPEDLEKARKGLFCSVHPKRDLELFCVDCDVCICLMCKVTDHLTHKTEDIQKTMDKAMSQLSEDRTRLTNAVLTTQKRIDEISKEQEALKRKEEAVEQNIHNRYNAVVAAAATVHEKALASLKTVSNDIHTNLSSAMEHMQQNLSKLCELKQQLEDCQKSGSVTQALKMVEEMKEGDRMEAAVENLTQEHVSAIIRPVLQYRDSAQEMVQGMQGYMGEAVQVDMDPCKPEVEVKEFIHCGRHLSDCQVFSLCPHNLNEQVWVSYKTSVLNAETLNSQLYDKKGRLIVTLKDSTGEVCLKLDEFDCLIYQQSLKPGIKSVSYVKSRKLMQLTDNFRGNISAERIRIISDAPFFTESNTEFMIHCGKQRACDIDEKEEFLIVVEEAEPPNTQRKVLLFQRQKPFPLDTYTPPNFVTHIQMPLTNPCLTTTDTLLTDHSDIEADKPCTDPILATTGTPLTDPSLTTTDTPLTGPSLTTGATLTDPSLATTGTALTHDTPGMTLIDPSLATTGTVLTDPSLATTGAALTDPSLATTGAVLTDPSLAATDTALPDPSIAGTDAALTDPSPTTTGAVLTEPSLLTTDKPFIDLNIVPELRFQPTDVCFYKLGGQEVLLVSDAARDAIHVLHVQEGKLRFLRYLAPGCPLLLQPSALNVDSKGRLWVACRGGSILVCTPLERSV